jgi:hypothetical protein
VHEWPADRFEWLRQSLSVIDVRLRMVEVSVVKEAIDAYITT